MRFLITALLAASVGCSGGDTGEKTADGDASPSPTQSAKNPLEDPSSLEMKKEAPAEFKATFETSKGNFTVKVTRAWAPNGADRFYNLVRHGYYDECRFFRVIRNPRPFMAQFGIHGSPKTAAVWERAAIPDDEVKESNTRGKMTYAMAGPNTRTTQVFINYGDNSRLDGQRFSPFGEVVEGMDVVDSFHADYGEGFPNGKGPSQNLIQARGNDYLKENFPKLDYVKKARIVK